MARRFYGAKRAEMNTRIYEERHPSKKRDSIDEFYPGREGMVEFYSGYDQMHKQEKADSGIIHEDRKAMANLPQEFMVKPYPKVYGNLDGYLDDTIRGIDDTIKENTPHGTSFVPKKY